MLYIFGDSHGIFSFKGCDIPNKNLAQSSITMYRVGRDQELLGFQGSYLGDDSIFIGCYGEVDCRCHVGKQILMGREEDAVCRELVDAYIATLKKLLTVRRAVIVIAVAPPTRQEEYEAINGPITHDFPFVGQDQHRVRYTATVNTYLEEACAKEGFVFLDAFAPYRREDGTLRYEFSDRCVHIANVAAFQEIVKDCVEKILESK